jgi:hypothetical protein
VGKPEESALTDEVTLDPGGNSLHILHELSMVSQPDYTFNADDIVTKEEA